jgi:hypothetical protein
MEELYKFKMKRQPKFNKKEEYMASILKQQIYDKVSLSGYF